MGGAAGSGGGRAANHHHPATAAAAASARLVADLFFTDLGDSPDEDEDDPVAGILETDLELMLV